MSTLNLTRNSIFREYVELFFERQSFKMDELGFFYKVSVVCVHL